jgi:RNA polymerase sigma-70 factor, ECF subfamily
MSEFLLKRVAAGDQKAVGEVVTAFGGLVWSLARRLSPTPADAEDAVQEIFLDVWKSSARFDPAQGSEKLFIAMIARRRLIDRLRRVRGEPQRAETTELETLAFADPGVAGERSVDALKAAQAVGSLKPDQQRVIALAVLDGLTHSEIAERTGLPLGTVKTQMRRGLIELRTRMGLDGTPEGPLAGGTP